MHIPVKVDYGVRALVDLAHHADEGAVRALDIALRQRIPQAYLDRLLHSLNKQGLINSYRGPQGGHALAMDPRDINLTMVFESMGGVETIVSCLDDPDVCIQSSACAQRDIWSELEQAVQAILDKTTIATLAARTPMAEKPSAEEAGKPHATPVDLVI